MEMWGHMEKSRGPGGRDWRDGAAAPGQLEPPEAGEAGRTLPESLPTWPRFGYLASRTRVLTFLLFTFFTVVKYTQL